MFMRARKIIFLVFPVLIGILSCKKNDERTLPPVVPPPVVTSMHFGVNLAGGEFGSTSGAYGVAYIYPNIGELDYYKSKGIKIIRLPFKWERLQPTLNGPLDPTELERVFTFVNAANDREILIVLDCHNYGRRSINGSAAIIGSAELPVQSFSDFWTKMAASFKTMKIWGYDIMNEPHDMLVTPSWFDIAQEAINGIRSMDQKTNIIVSGDGWSSPGIFGSPGSKSDVLKDLSDPSDKLIFQAHVYFDKNNSGTYQGSYDAEGGYPGIGVDRVRPFIEWLKLNNKKGFIGEYGVPGNDVRWLVVLDNFLKHLKDNCVNGTYWAGGPWWGSYPLSIEPSNGVDKPQMGVVRNYLTLPSSCP